MMRRIIIIGGRVEKWNRMEEEKFISRRQADFLRGCYILFTKKMFMTLNILKWKEFLFCLEKSSPLVVKMEFGIFGCYFLFLHEMSQMRLTAGRKLIAEVISNFGIMNFPFLRSEFGSQSRD